MFNAIKPKTNYVLPKCLGLASKACILSSLSFCVALTACNTNSDETINDPTAITNHSETKQNNTQSDNDSTVVDALQSNLNTSGLDQKITTAVPTDMQDIYWVTAEGVPAFFTDKQGKYIIQGQIIEVGGSEPVDITADLLAKLAKEKLANVPADEMVIYPANGETKSTVYIFTDADCPYCTKLHAEMDQINRLGVEVRYLAWPRSDQSVPKMEAVWCSEDRNAAMDAAKSGMSVAAARCDNPVRRHVELGLGIGVRGTPAIYTESGKQIGGYLPARKLAKAATE